MKYRPHKRLLADAMAEVVELPDRAALVDHLAKDLAHWGMTLEDDDVKVTPYGHDDRIGWDTYIVTIRNKQTSGGIWYFGEAVGPDYFGAIGFTDSPAPRPQVSLYDLLGAYCDVIKRKANGKTKASEVA